MLLACKLFRTAPILKKKLPDPANFEFELWDGALLHTWATSPPYRHQAGWPDLAKFRHFYKIFKVLGYFLSISFLFGIILDQLWQILYAIGEVFIDVNGQMLKII